MNDTVSVRLVLPASVHRELRKLGIDLELGPSDTLLEAVAMLLRYHDRGFGLPEPRPPCPPPEYR